MKFKIGEVSKLLGVSTQAIRAYEDAGILTPSRSEYGTRYFDVWQVIRLLSFKKYRAMELPIAQVVDHFHDDTLAQFDQTLCVHADSLRERAAALLRQADAVDRHRAVIAGAPYDFLPCDSPAQYRLDDIIDLLHEHRHLDTLENWLAALPVMAISPMFRADALDAEPTWGLSIEEGDAPAWGVRLDMPGVVHLPSTRCVRIGVQLASPRSFSRAFAPALRRLNQSGYALDPIQPIWGRQIASETVANQVTLHYLFYFPIKE